MTALPSLSLRQARRLVLEAQGFAAPTTSPASPRRIHALLERLGVVQIDTINRVVRSHYLPLFSRLGDYPRESLDRAAWGAPRQRRLFEYWGHEASLLPLDLYPLLAWRRRRAAQGLGIYTGLAAFGREQQPLIQDVLRRIRDDGPSGAGQLRPGPREPGTWWNWSEEKTALEWLFAAGQVAVATRRGFERIYDLPERVMPAELLAAPAPDSATAHRTLVLRSAKALGVATEADLRDYFRLTPQDTRAALAELLEEGVLHSVRVEGWPKPAYCLEPPISRRRKVHSALLSPFDSLLWDRKRTERLFDFHYRLEIYKPKEHRIHGYYVLPFLHDERLQARVDLRSDRASGRLEVLAIHPEPGFAEDAGMALAEQLDQLARWLGLARTGTPRPAP